MDKRNEAGFTLIELLVVLFIVTIIALTGWNVLSGWRERNALRLVSQDIQFVFEKYRQRAIDKGINYGLIFSDDGIYVFEDNGGTGTDPFLALNNFAIDTGEFSDKWRGGASGNSRLWRRVTDRTTEFSYFAGPDAWGRLMVMTATATGLTAPRTGTPYTPAGTDITSAAVVDFGGGADAPFSNGSLALIFSPDGYVYLKDPTTVLSPADKFPARLGNGGVDYYIVRVAYDRLDTAVPEVPDYFEIALNRYGSSKMIRWHSGNGGATWNAQIQ